eukprot:gnl/MRDRNA2_/MRDRNA2_89405_c0_seq1.p1 gnl/MRDRNA2_/MRDRNA2_89405_c0~~gnl/MRDRNA2_/MRDRNA2_89405_c0_seq1.p1  ORF type:complete len:347 (+),score=51.50 gnl/MRDRNA2_/MRDRNA2_89405_c0_seq1:93-1133(+)
MSGDYTDARTITAAEDEATEDDDQGESLTTKPRWFSLLLVGCYLLVGVLVMTLVSGENFGKAADERMSPLTAFYIIVQIITTIGYGDITVATDRMRIFMSFYVLLGIAFVANVINDFGNAMLEREAGSVRAHLYSIKNQKSIGEKHVPSRGEKYKLYALGAAILIFSFFVFTWMAFFALYESCSCSYGQSAVAGCEPTNCTQTDAQTKNWTQAFYMAVITMTTVGFGDYSPQSELGRGFGCVWMILGVLASANMVSAIGSTVSAISSGGSSNRLEKIKFSETVFEKMDLDKNGRIGKAEFLHYVLLKEGIIHSDTVDQILDLFETLDADGSGGLTLKELEETFDED